MVTCSQLYNFLSPVMGSMVNLLGLYHNYQTVVELILELYCESAKRMLCYLNTTARYVRFQMSLSIINVFVHKHLIF